MPLPPSFRRALLLALGAALGGAGAHAGTPPAAPKARPARAPALPPAPLLSARAKVVSTPEGAGVAFDDQPGNGHWAAGHPTPEAPALAAVDLGRGKSRVLFVWSSSGNSNYEETTYGGPGSYRLETSADSTDGKNGTWKTAVTVTDNAVASRAHAVEFKGRRWLRLAVTGPSPQTYEYGVQVDRMQVHDVSRSAKDTWLFVGDSITAAAFDQHEKRQPSFAALLRKRGPTYAPVMLHAGVGGLKSGDLVQRLPRYLEHNPDLFHWCIGIGSNDAADKPEQLAAYRQDLEALVKALQAAGKQVLLARVPHQTGRDVSALNAELDAVVKKFGLHPGPDFQAHFAAHPEQLRDGLHPTDEGAREMNRLWAEAVADLDPR